MKKLTPDLKKICRVCSKLFTPTHAAKIVCGEICLKKRYSLLGKKFRLKNKKIRVLSDGECKRCQKKFQKNTEGQKFCTSVCSQIWWKENWKEHRSLKPETIKECVGCKKKFVSANLRHKNCSPECSLKDGFAGLRFKVLKRDGFRCTYCGMSPKDGKTILHVDHIHPKYHGGKDTIENLTTACEKCNLGKGRQII